MSDVIPELTEEEASALQTMAHGAALLALRFSRWEKPIEALSARGYCQPRPYPGGGVEYIITDAGAAAIEAWENDALRDVIRVNNEVAQAKAVPATAFTQRQIDALANFYYKMTGRNPSEICPP